MNNNPSPDFSLGKRMTGFVREAPKKFTPNAAKRQTILGHPDGRYSSILAVTIKPPTQQFPSPAFNLQVSNGNGSAFQRISGPADLRELAHALALWADELEPLWTTLLAQGEQLTSIQKEVEQRASMFKEMIEQMGNEPPQFDDIPQESFDAN